MEFPLTFEVVLLGLVVAAPVTIYLPLVVGGVITGRRHKAMDKRIAFVTALAVLAVLLVAVVGWWLPQAQAGSLAFGPAPDRLAPRLASGEGSMPWGGTSVGDAGPYTDDVWSDMQAAFLTYDNATEGVLPSNISGYTGNLAVTSASSVTVSTASGFAVVDGKFYFSNSAVGQTIVPPGSGSNYYRVVLRKSFAAQTVRNTLLGPDAGAYPSLTQNTTSWDLPLARVVVTSAGAVTVTDDRKLVGRGGAWAVVGNTGLVSGTNYLGTADNVDLIFKVNATEVGRLEYDATSPNTTWGHSANLVAAGVSGGTIGGGGATGANANDVTANYGTVAGGYNNIASGAYSTVAGGRGNGATGSDATVVGGQSSAASGSWAVTGGYANTASGDHSVVWGEESTASGQAAIVAGGYLNTASGNYSSASGYESTATNYGQESRAAGKFATAGDAQGSLFTVRLAQTSHVSGTWYTLFTDGSSAQMIMPISSTWSFHALVVGQTSGGAQAWGYEIKGTIKRTAGATTIMGTPTVVALYEADADYDAQAAAVEIGPDGMLAIQVRRTDVTDYNIRWVATVRTVEVTYP